MEQTILASKLFLGGCVGHYLLRRSGDLGIWLMRTFKFGWANDPKYTFTSYRFNNKGESSTSSGNASGVVEVKFDETQQKAVDTIVQQRIAREREKFSDYEDLRKFKTEYEKSQDQVKQKELENQKNYEEAKKGYEGKLSEFSQKLTAKEQEIQNLRVEHTLTNEISKNNGFIEESVALLKGQVKIDATGNMVIAGKDANGLDINIPLADGVKKFYDQRPHLVKSTHKAGGGTGSGNADTTGTGNSGTGASTDLNYLNAQLLKAQGSGDGKQYNEIKAQIKSVLKSKGIGG